MNIPLSAILYQITDVCDWYPQNVALYNSYESILLFEPDHAESVKDNCLCFLTEGMLENNFDAVLSCGSMKRSIFICYITNKEIMTDKRYSDLRLVYLMPKSQATFSMVFNSLLYIFHTFDRWDKTLHLDILKNSSLQTILNHTTDIVSHPMLILDANMTVCASIKPDNETDIYMEQLLRLGYATPEMLREFRNKNVLPANLNAEPLQISKYTYSDKNEYYSMCYRLGAKSTTFAYALIFHCRSHPSESYQYLTDIVMENISLYFTQKHYDNVDHTDDYEFFLNALIDDPNMSDSKLKSLIAFIDTLRIEGNFSLARINLDTDKKNPTSFISWNIKNTFPNMRPFMHKNSLYVLKLAKESSDVLNDFIEEDKYDDFWKCFSGSSGYCTVSNAFFNLRYLEYAVKQCDITNDFVKNSGFDKKIAYYRDYSLKDLQHLLNSHEAIIMTTSPYYAVLNDYDLMHKTDLCNVFSIYIQNGGNVNKTAETLFMHRNTIQNKIKKATAILKNNLSNYNDAFFFVLNHIRS